MASSQIALSTCARLVEQAGAQCTVHAATAPPVATAAPDFNAMATSLASQNNAIAIGAAALGALGLVIALVGLLAGLAWGRMIKNSADEIAREAAAIAANNVVSAWMDANGHQRIADEVAKIMDARDQEVTEATAAAEAEELQAQGDAA